MRNIKVKSLSSSISAARGPVGDRDGEISTETPYFNNRENQAILCDYVNTRNWKYILKTINKWGLYV
jgi:hypothetical protein